MCSITNSNLILIQIDSNTITFALKGIKTLISCLKSTN